MFNCMFDEKVSSKLNIYISCTPSLISQNLIARPKSNFLASRDAIKKTRALILKPNISNERFMIKIITQILINMPGINSIWLQLKNYYLNKLLWRDFVIWLHSQSAYTKMRQKPTPSQHAPAYFKTASLYAMWINAKMLFSFLVCRSHTLSHRLLYAFCTHTCWGSHLKE